MSAVLAGLSFGPPQQLAVTALCTVLAAIGTVYTIVSKASNDRREHELARIRAEHDAALAQREHELQALKVDNENQLAERAQELATLKQAQDALAVGLTYSESANAALRKDVGELRVTIATNEERCRAQLDHLNALVRSLGGTVS